MRRRTPGVLLVVLLAILGTLSAPAPAQADPLNDVLSMIEHHQLALPVQPNQAPSYMSSSLGHFYAGPRGLELRFTSSGSVAVIKAGFYMESVAYGTAVVGAVTSMGALALSVAGSKVLRTTLQLAGVVVGQLAGPDIDNAIQRLLLRNLCLGITIPPGSLVVTMDRAIRFIAERITGLAPSTDNISLWLEPCSPQPQANVTVPMALPGIAGVLPAQPMVAPPSGNPFGTLDETSLVADATKVRVRGWAADPSAPTGPITVHTYIDGTYAGATTANVSRPDVGAVYAGYGNNHGYDVQYPVAVGAHQVCTYAINVGAGNANPQLPYCKTVKRQDRISELAFVRTNHSSGRTELSAWHGSPNYTTLYHSQSTGYPAISDPQWVKSLAIDTNGDGVDELGFVRFNHASGHAELSLWHGAPHYTTLLLTTPTGYPAISDPQNVTPVAIDTNGDGTDELGFVRTNHSSGRTELSLWHGAPHYTTLLTTSLTGYPAISDPQNVTPLAIDANGDGVDEIAFVRSNHGSGRTEVSIWHGSPSYTTLLTTALTGYPAIGDPANVTPIALDANGDRVEELAFARTNTPGCSELSIWHGSPGYTTLLKTTNTGYPAISDPQNVTVLAMHLPS